MSTESFGHYGDRIGRETMLVTTILITGMAAFLVGALPSYDAMGILAPIMLLLLRVLQGIGLGGEWGGVTLISSYIAVLCALGVLCYFLADETHRKDIYEEPAGRRLVAEQRG